MGERWVRPVHVAPVIEGGYMLLRSHALLALWQMYREGHIRLLDVRTAFAAAEVSHRRATALRLHIHRTRRAAKHARHARDDADPLAIQRLTRCHDIRKSRASLRRLANMGVPAEHLFGRAGTGLPVCVMGDTDIADRPVPVPRRLLCWLAREGTAALIAVAIAHLLRGAYLRGGAVRLGGTCSAAWIASVFAIDERTAKAGRCGLVERGWLVPAPSPFWHRQRYGATFTVNPTWLCPVQNGGDDETGRCTRRGAVVRAGADAPGLPPRWGESALGMPPPKKNKNLPLRGTENQNRASGHCGPPTARVTADSSSPDPWSKSPTMTDVQEADLCHPKRTVLLLADAQRRGLIGRSECERLQFFTTAQHALRTGARPCALFAALARSKRWHFGSQQDEQSAQRCVQSLLCRSIDTEPAMSVPTPVTNELTPKHVSPPPHQSARCHTRGFRSVREILLGIDVRQFGAVPPREPSEKLLPIRNDNTRPTRRVP